MIDEYVEKWTTKMHDMHYREDDEKICDQCGDEFYEWEEHYKTKYSDDLFFCCQSCRDTWEEENSSFFEDE